jgi:hypothetical protein
LQTFSIVLSLTNSGHSFIGSAITRSALGMTKTGTNLKQTLRAILSSSSASALDPKFRAAAKKRWGYEWANVIRSWIDRELRYGAW